jgi:F0F1-type ATP synthase assembly protein I
MPNEPDRMKPNEQPDQRSPFAVAMEWTSRISVISMEMILPTLGGLWLDQHWRTRPLFLILGGILGFSIAMSSLLQLGKRQDPKP